MLIAEGGIELEQKGRISAYFYFLGLTLEGPRGV